MMHAIKNEVPILYNDTRYCQICCSLTPIETFGRPNIIWHAHSLVLKLEPQPPSVPQRMPPAPPRVPQAPPRGQLQACLPPRSVSLVVQSAGPIDSDFAS